MSESHVGSTQGQQYRLAHHQSLPIAPINQSQLSNEQGARAPDQNYSALMDTVSRTRTELAFVREDLSDRIYATIDRIDTGMTALQTTQTEILNTLRAISDGNPLSRSPSNEPAQPPTQGAQEEQARKRGREEDDDTDDFFDRYFDDETFDIGTLETRVICLPDHTRDCVGYIIGANVFTADSVLLLDVSFADLLDGGGSEGY
ncbi:hypothetical protein F4819DRAFT_490708 [Hypoxylon fuscum]|nr:hypothetical protein F4819DRAFT_490708 [Hypoxylon fuscum]